MRALLASLPVVLLFAGWSLAQPPVASYTGDQATEGRTAYDDSCATCHTAALQGGLDAPPLAGDEFLGLWGGRPARELLSYIRAAMPPAGRKPDDETLASIVAYILDRNGMNSGQTRFGPDDRGIIAVDR